MFNFLRRWFYKLIGANYSQSICTEDQEIDDWLNELELIDTAPTNISSMPYVLPSSAILNFCKSDRTHIFIEDNNHYLQTSGAINLKRTCTKDKMVDGFIRNAPERSKMINNLIRERDRIKTEIGMANIMNRDSWLSQE